MANNHLRVLRRKEDFEFLKRKGSKVTPTKWLLLSYKKNDLTYCRFGWSIGRKVGNAVIRNRLKRWCRDFFRTNQFSTRVNFDVNVVIKPGQQEFYKQLSHSEFVEALERAWAACKKNC